MYLDIALKILVSILIVLVIICIPILLKLWRVTEDIALSLQTLNQSLPLILKNLEEITTNISISTNTLNEKIQNMASVSDRSHLLITDIINNLGLFAPVAMRFPVFRIIRNVVALAKGAQVFMNVLLHKKNAE
ncbi:MAG TPA: hypothetical protein DIT25_00120 [Candidatus Moranbacteria bacterium]|nr:hypothetical protein [Candidatus Moranbacteria bacterium]